MKIETVSTLIRTGLKFGGGFLVSKGLIDDAGLTEAIGAIVTLVGVVWGILAARKSAANAQP